MPEPSADHALPFHFAMRTADNPSAVVKPPPAYRFAPLTASAETLPFSPVPSADHALPSHFAIRFAATVPIAVKLPPTYRFPPPSATTTPMLPFAPGSPPKLTQSASEKVGSIRTG